jgi:hypothetical protein
VQHTQICSNRTRIPGVQCGPFDAEAFRRRLQGYGLRIEHDRARASLLRLQNGTILLCKLVLVSGGPEAHEGAAVVSRFRSTSPTIWIDAHMNASIAIEPMMAELSDVLLDVWSQVLLHNSNIVKLGSNSQFPRARRDVFARWNSPSAGKRSLGFNKNPDTKSNWAKMARSGIKVMQFIQEGRYIAVVAAGKVTIYGKRTA